MKTQAISDEICCPEFDPQLWDHKTVMWKDKPFICDTVRTVFYMPLNFGSIIKRLDKACRGAGAINKDFMCLADHQSMWKMDLLLAVDKHIPNTQNTALSGLFYSIVYEGTFNNTNRWTKHFYHETHDKGLEIEKLYFWYTTCPKCAKKYGKNYVVIVGKVKE